MRHRKSTLRLNKKPQHARMQERNLVTSLLLYEWIRTTQKRAKVIAPVVDRLVRVAKSDSPHIAIRRINAVVTDKNACRKIMEVLKERYSNRTSGLTRITSVGARKGDGAKIVDMMMVDADGSNASSVQISKTQRTQKTQTKSSSGSSGSPASSASSS
jgi:large subunit ribosomal protein L17